MSTLQQNTGISNPPLRANVITDAQGQENTPGFLAVLSQLWQGWFRTVTAWANLQGTTQRQPFNAADFGVAIGAGSWTVASINPLTYTSRIVGDTLFFNVFVYPDSTAVVAGVVDALKVNLPTRSDGLYTLAESVWIPCFVYEGNTNPVAAIASTTGGGPNAVTITKVPFGAFTVGWVGVSFQIAAQVTY